MKKNRHDLSFYRLSTFDMGQLVPVGVVEVLPGDVFRHSASVMARLSPLAAPVMHPVQMRVHHFFVPHRLTWDESAAGCSFEDFITGGPDGTNTCTVPVMNTSGIGGDLMDHLGLPQQAGIQVSKLPVRAYNLIYNEWYRDQDLAGTILLDNTSLQNIAWEKDYFSTSRPWSQKGEEVTLPLGQYAPVESDTTPPTFNDGSQELELQTENSGISANFNFGGTGVKTVTFGANSGLRANLQQASAITVNSLRTASALQRFAEARARWGSRYAEYVRTAFGARPLDARLQRPEYLGGGTQQISISEVLQTAPEASGRAFGVGDMYGHGIGVTRSNRYKAAFQEHGYVISLMSVRPKAMYTNGIPRTYLRSTREDFYQHELATVGQQQVKTAEVYATPTNQGQVFGWSDRYQEYRYQRSEVAGEFRDTLDYWHLGRQFTSEPALNRSFVECEPSETKRIFNEQAQNSLWVTSVHRLQALRTVRKDATPRLL